MPKGLFSWVSVPTTNNCFFATKGMFPSTSYPDAKKDSCTGLPTVQKHFVRSIISIISITKVPSF